DRPPAGGREDRATSGVDARPESKCSSSPSPHHTVASVLEAPPLPPPCAARTPPVKPHRESTSPNTLERAFSKAGCGSRTQARSWIETGQVRVNGKPVRNPDRWVDASRDRITLDGKPLRPAARRYFLLYKPKGYLTTRGDPEGRPTVYDLIRGVDAWLSPVG